MTQNRNVLSTRIEHEVLVVEAAGEYSRQALDEQFLEAVSRPEARKLVGVLLDLRQSVSMPQRTAAELHESAAFYASHKDRIGGRVAIVAASDAAYGLGRMASVTAEHLGLEVFVSRDLHKAWAFLLTA